MVSPTACSSASIIGLVCSLLALADGACSGKNHEAKSSIIFFRKKKSSIMASNNACVQPRAYYQR